MQYLEQCLEKEGRTYNSLQLAHKLSQERQVKLSPDRLRHLLQKRALSGNAHGERHRAKQNIEYKLLKQAQLNALKQVEQLGGVELIYLDESGCKFWSPVSYSYSRVGEQKRIEQTDRRNGRISILGVWQPDKSFKYAIFLWQFQERKLYQSHRLDCRASVPYSEGNRTYDRGGPRQWFLA